MYAYDIVRSNSITLAFWLTSQLTHAQTGPIYLHIKSFMLFVRDAMEELNITWEPPKAPVAFTDAVEGAPATATTPNVGSSGAVPVAALPVPAVVPATKEDSVVPAPLRQFGRKQETKSAAPVVSSTVTPVSVAPAPSTVAAVAAAPTSAPRTTIAIQTVQYAEQSTQTDTSFDWIAVRPPLETGVVGSLSVSHSPSSASHSITSAAALHARLGSAMSPRSAGGSVGVAASLFSPRLATDPGPIPFTNPSLHARVPSGSGAVAANNTAPAVLPIVEEDDDDDDSDEEAAHSSRRNDPGGL